LKEKQKAWTGVEHQSPAPKLEIFFNADSNTPDITYSPYPATVGVWLKNLLSYTFSESTDDLEGNFSFAIENETIDKKEKTVFDLIPVRSVVKIFEGNTEKPTFVGIIRRREIKKSMTSQGVKRSVIFTGKSIISCVTEHCVSLDVRIQGISDNMSKNIDLTNKLSREELTIKTFMIETWEHFKKVSEDVFERTGTATVGIAKVIQKFLGDPGQFIDVSGKGQGVRYDLACVFYNAANNYIADVWRNILPERVYEFFSRCEDGKPKIIARQVPFQPEDWSSLDLYEISPISLISYDINQSDKEVYTAFASYVIGSAMEKKFYMAVTQTGDDSTVKYDNEKTRLYGYKPLELNFNGYDRQGNAKEGERSKLEEDFKELNEMACYWYSRLDDMYTGSLTMTTDFNRPENNPRVGCRAKFIGGEFYINKADHSWNFGGTPLIKLTVSRGMIYDASGEMKDGPDGIIKNVGSRFRELEREVD